MDVTEKEAFKIGFLYRCAEEGLAGTTLQARIKSAEAFVKLAVGGLDFSNVGNYFDGLKSVAVFPLLAAAGVGGLAGHVTGKLTEPDVDVEDIKAKELAAAYKAYAARAKTNKKLRLYRPER
jgi:hypothetical protein